MNNNRLASIDIFRALTMMLMIFVIDAASLSDIPDWLGHAAADEDRMGLADIVFPFFMFALGLSIPHAIKARINKKESKWRILVHITTRTLSLLIMGIFVVNLDNMNAELMIIEKSYWQILMVLAFLMIWNDYTQEKALMSSPPRVMLARLIQISGVALLIILALLYKGQTGSGMQTHWWGILGLLGWSYGACAALYLFIGDRVAALMLTVLIFLTLNINEFVGGLNIQLIISASNYFSVMLGVLSAVIYTQLTSKADSRVTIVVLLSIAAGLISFGLATRPEWDISKIRATPSWTTICAGISMICFVVVSHITDTRRHVAWAKPIAAGGYATLTCYLTPYLVYAALHIGGFKWPEVMSTSFIGLVKSLFFALFIIQITAWAGRLKIRLSM